MWPARATGRARNDSPVGPRADRGALVKTGDHSFHGDRSAVSPSLAFGGSRATLRGVADHPRRAPDDRLLPVELPPGRPPSDRLAGPRSVPGIGEQRPAIRPRTVSESPRTTFSRGPAGTPQRPSDKIPGLPGENDLAYGQREALSGTLDNPSVGARQAGRWALDDPSAGTAEIVDGSSDDPSTSPAPTLRRARDGPCRTSRTNPLDDPSPDPTMTSARGR
jgi:hypothetical protein